MATGSMLVKTVILYLSISIILYAGGVRLVGDNSTFDNFISAANPNASITNNQYNLGANISGVTPNVEEQSTFSTGINFIDIVRATKNFIQLIVNVVFAIPTLFFSFPAPVQLFVGVPLGVVALLGVIYFTRSGQ